MYDQVIIKFKIKFIWTSSARAPFSRSHLLAASPQGQKFGNHGEKRVHPHVHLDQDLSRLAYKLRVNRPLYLRILHPICASCIRIMRSSAFRCIVRPIQRIPRPSSRSHYNTTTHSTEWLDDLPKPSSLPRMLGVDALYDLLHSKSAKGRVLVVDVRREDMKVRAVPAGD